MTNTSIALNMIRGLYYVGGDFTEGSIVNSATETEVLDYDIPAGTVTNGIIIIASCRNELVAQISTETVFRIKVGDNGSEVERCKTKFNEIGGAADLSGTIRNQGFIVAVVDDEDWSAGQTVSVTADMDGADGFDTSYGEYVVILGY